MSDDFATIAWLRRLAADSGKGVVNNIDARSLGRIADRLETLGNQEACATAKALGADIIAAWEEVGSVPFPLYDREAEDMAEALLKQYRITAIPSENSKDAAT
jgi:hypothetical protein